MLKKPIWEDSTIIYCEANLKPAQFAYDALQNRVDIALAKHLIFR